MVTSVLSPHRAHRGVHGLATAHTTTEVAMKLLMIFRVFYNYVAVGEDKKTPAMRLGLAKKMVSLSDVINFAGSIDRKP